MGQAERSLVICILQKVTSPEVGAGNPPGTPEGQEKGTLELSGGARPLTGPVQGRLRPRPSMFSACPTPVLPSLLLSGHKVPPRRQLCQPPRQRVWDSPGRRPEGAGPSSKSSPGRSLGDSQLPSLPTLGRLLPQQGVPKLIPGLPGALRRNTHCPAPAGVQQALVAQGFCPAGDGTPVLQVGSGGPRPQRSFGGSVRPVSSITNYRR